MIGLGTRITSTEEFNRRALIALRGVKTTSPFLKNMIGHLSNGVTLSPKQQSSFFNAVHAHRRQITDVLVTEYAAERGRGAD